MAIDGCDSAAAAEDADDPVGADLRARLEMRRRLEKSLVVVVSGEQRDHFVLNVGGLRRGAHEGLAGGPGFGQRPLEQRADALPALRRHASSLCSQARAIVQCRLTVAGEMSSASAVSSTVMPPK